MCQEWLDDSEAFYRWSVKNGHDEAKSLDRKDVNGDYSPENCRWADDITQHNNTRVNHQVTLGDRTQAVAQWARELGIRFDTLLLRLRRGIAPERALTPGRLK
jgi:hypothetical protein